MSISGGKREPTNPTVSDASGSSGSVDFSASNSSSSSFRDPASVWGGQSPYLTSLYGAAGDLAQNFGATNQQAQGVYDRAMQGFDRMMNPGVNPQLNAYAGDVQRNLERNLLPAIQSNAQGFGQGGGSRQGIAEGLALSDANQQVTDMASNMYNADMNRMGQAMSMAPSLGTFGQQIPWYAMNQYSGILGDPTVLQGAAGSESSSSSAGGGSSWSENVSHSEGGGGGGGWDFGFGFPTS